MKKLFTYVDENENIVKIDNVMLDTLESLASQITVEYSDNSTQYRKERLKHYLEKIFTTQESIDAIMHFIQNSEYSTDKSFLYETLHQMSLKYQSANLRLSLAFISINSIASKKRFQFIDHSNVEMTPKFQDNVHSLLTLYRTLFENIGKSTVLKLVDQILSNPNAKPFILSHKIDTELRYRKSILENINLKLSMPEHLPVDLCLDKIGNAVISKVGIKSLL